MTRSQMERSLRSQQTLAALYMRKFERADAAGDQREACRLYPLWAAHNANAQVWANRLEGRG